MADSRGRGGRGGRGDFGGRGRGEFAGRGRGDGGRGRGDFGGRGRGDSGGRGRGDYGGRGGGHSFDGGRGRAQPGGYAQGSRPVKFEGEEMVFGARQKIPQPDSRITQLENDILKNRGDDLATKMASLDLSETPFPCRPAFGTQGTKVTVWANYFKLELKSPSTSLVKYTVDINLVKKPNDPKMGKKKGPQNAKAAAEPRPPAGKKLYRIMSRALEQVVSKDVACATDFKKQVILSESITLPADGTVTVAYTDEGRDDEFTVKFNGPTNVDLSGLLEYLDTFRDQTLGSWPKFENEINALTIITGFYARRNQATTAALGNRFFPLNLDSEQTKLDYIEWNRVIRGYFQSARPATGRLILNVNVAHGVFRLTGPITKYIDDSKHVYEQINSSLGRMRLRARCKMFLPNGTSRIVQRMVHGLATPGDGIKPKPIVPQVGAKADKVQFHLETQTAGFAANTFVSVQNYYKKRYNYDINLKYPLINLVSKDKNPIYVPAEHVEIIDGQPLRRKTTGEETTGMINFSCRSPFANATSITTIGRQVLGLESGDHLAAFGVQVGSNLLTVEARELQPPKIVYKDGRQANKDKVVLVNEGEWNMDTVRFTKPGSPINRWVWLHIDTWNHSKHAQVEQQVYDWLGFMRTMGLSISPTALNSFNKDNPGAQYQDPRVKVDLRRGSVIDQLRPVFVALKKLHNPQNLFVVLPGKKTDTDVYNAVKTLAESGNEDFGFITNCVVENNLLKKAGNPRSQAQLFANLGLKVNLKMGGANHRLQSQLGIMRTGEKTMLVGYDVLHPTNLQSGAEGKPSLVALVASIDDDLAQWPAILWRQDGKVEMLDAAMLEKGFFSRLFTFDAKNNRLPDNIVIYRDGVSEGQFQQVLDKELPSIRKACEAAPYKQRGQPLPKITILVSVKRHQTRFYPTDKDHMVSSRNIRNGTVVDRGVTQANIWDFFLTAHKGLQGTSRPAHYTVLLDEIFRSKTGKNAANELEKMTLDMCHLFGRATKAVSICPPAYYADIACTRSKVYLSDLFDGSDTQSVATRKSEKDKDKQPDPAVKISIHPNLQNVMFYI